MNRLIELTSGFTPAEIQYLFQQVADFTFEQECATQKKLPSNRRDIYPPHAESTPRL